MSEDLLKLVKEELLPALAPLGFRVISSEVADVFDNANVVLEAPEMRVRVLRERNVVVLDIGPASEPNTWFDSAVVLDYLGLSSHAGFHDRDVRRVLRGVAAFVTSMRSELTAIFSQQQLPKTKKELTALREERAQRLFGS